LGGSIKIEEIGQTGTENRELLLSRTEHDRWRKKSGIIAA